MLAVPMYFVLDCRETFYPFPPRRILNLHERHAQAFPPVPWIVEAVYLNRHPYA